MASKINITNIDTTYPIAGQDNDTQGFRTNFTNIKNNFVTAASEITQLQGNVVNLQQFGTSSHATVAAAGTTQVDATPITTQTVTVSSSSLAQGIVLPTPTTAGQVVYINSGANGVSVYPSASGRIDSLAINYPKVLSATTFWIGVCESTNPIVWTSYIYQISSANVNISTLAANVESFKTYANATFVTSSNVASYLPTYTGNISAGNITVTGAIQFANLTTQQISNIAPGAGMTVYNYTTGNIQVYTGTTWANITLS
jgi:hypothetical protein